MMVAVRSSCLGGGVSSTTISMNCGNMLGVSISIGAGVSSILQLLGATAAGSSIMTVDGTPLGTIKIVSDSELNLF